MQLVKKEISLHELKKMAENKFGNLVKAVVDTKKQIMVVDAELHSDQETLLLKNGSEQENIWGINLYPDMKGEDFIEFDSMINIRPSFGNSTRNVENSETRKKIRQIVEKLITK